MRLELGTKVSSGPPIALYPGLPTAHTRFPPATSDSIQCRSRSIPEANLLVKPIEAAPISGRAGSGPIQPDRPELFANYHGNRPPLQSVFVHF